MKNEFYNLLQNINPIIIKPNNLTFDTNSGTIVGNTSIMDISKLPILSKKLIGIDTTYNPNIRYSKGDRVKYRALNQKGEWIDQEWESLVNNNIGNTPTLSHTWEIVDNLTNYYTSRLKVMFDNSKYQDTGEILPSDELVIFDDSSILEVKVKGHPGFEIDLEKVKIFPPINGSNEINRREVGINGSIKYNYSHISSQDMGEMFIFQGKEILDILRKLDYLYFISNPKTYTLSFDLIKKIGESEELGSWDNNLKINYTIGDSSGTLGSTTDFISVNTKDMVSLSLPEDEKRFSLLGISTGDKIYEVNEDGIVNFPIEITEQNSQILKYTVILNSETVQINVVEYNDFIVEDPSITVVYEGNCSIRFYKEVEDNFGIEITINNKVISNDPNVILSEKDNDGIYTLSLSAIKENLEVKLKKSNKV